ncbi:oxidoreductase [Actinorhabdospora filicis]|uniref:Oxidoreductase n=1 Tax=Actinorhabdospora filicis TaxID=1785913 RepID=A0A9W6SRN3_9ACTN|nr:pyridoxamine 5'-phosphate oxidase family protein [Actinorhabdospora filicis]GLZ79496.1 oxidoreductase [Actinorhabdospora filicis]
MLHTGEVAVQQRAGVRAPKMGSARVGADIPEVAAGFLAAQAVVVIAGDDASGDRWAGAVFGAPGFATAPDARTVDLRALPGEPLGGAFDNGAEIGMIAIEPATRRRMRVNGRAERDGEGLRVRTTQVYSNCPKYIQARETTGLFTDPPGPAVRGGALTTGQRELIAAADTFFIATGAEGVGLDASHRGGAPGFVTVHSGSRLSFPDYRGNAMYMTLGNLELDPRCGLLFWDFEGDRALHVTGTASTDWDADRAAAVPGAMRMVDVEVTGVVEVPGGQRLRWDFHDYSPANPALV